ncbi:MAG: PepSY-associated TM helix domain-containing protein [Rhodocyclaceae bacterium]
MHLYAGLLLGALFALLGLTGSVLTFYLEVDTAFNPAQRVAQPALTAPAPDAVLARLKALYPDRDGPWRIEMPLAADDALRVRYYNPVETAGRGFAPLMLSLDPATLNVTSERFWGDYAVTWLYDLHYTLLLGAPGTQWVGIAGWLMLLSMFSGLYLWWPSRARLASALKPVLRRGIVRTVYDLHVLTGVYGFVVLATLAFTGCVLALHGPTRAVVEVFSPVQDLYRAPAGLATGEPRLALEAAVAIARQRFPDAELRWIESSGARGTPIMLRLRQPDEPGRRFPQTRLWLHPVSGDILAVRDPGQNSGGDTFFAWMHPLHNGEAFGLPGRILACIGGVMPLIIFVTGWIRWRQKRRARRAGERGRSASGAPA